MRSSDLNSAGREGQGLGELEQEPLALTLEEVDELIAGEVQLLEISAGLQAASCALDLEGVSVHWLSACSQRCGGGGGSPAAAAGGGRPREIPVMPTGAWG